jgi:hypothetical protein
MVFALLALGSSVSLPASASIVRTDAARLEKSIAAVKNGATDDFYAAYDDIHPFHGGTSIEVWGSGLVLRVDQQPRRSHQKVSTYRATPEQIARIAGLLAQVKAWEQREPDRPARHDESAAELNVKIGAESGGFWEWYNDMGRNQRLSLVKAELEKLAPAPKGGAQ